ncbi:MAG: hypothetical protein HY655_08415 [Acidobacteria bacterium]|nr:hypothetical protein [Acidobacteriota bacterium]
MSISSPSNRDGAHEAARRPALLALAGIAAGAILLLTARGQIYDTNFQTLWESTELLAGDHPYRDFYEWGLPLQAAVSAVAQVLTGHRLIGEFLVHWIFITAGVIIALHLALQLSHSVAASLITIGLAVILLAETPTYHYPKLFLYPFALWIAWKYIDQPGVRLGAALGLTTAAAFLFRHDHGVYVGVLAVVVLGLARLAVPASRTMRSMIAESASYTAAASILLLPWLIVVQVNEGVPEYVRARMYLYSDWSTTDSPYLSLLEINPVRTLRGDRAVAPRPATISLTWNANVDATERAALERRYRLRPLGAGEDTAGKWHYEVPNVNDVELWDLRRSLDNADSTEGLDWERLERLRAPAFVPTRDAAERWLYQLALLVSVLLLVSGGLHAARALREGRPVPIDAVRAVSAAVFLYAIERSLLREASYVMAIIPLVAGVSAGLLRRPPAAGGSRDRWLGRLWPPTRLAVVGVMLVVTSLSVFAYTRGTGIYEPLERIRSVGPVLSELLTAPPIDGYQPAAAARGYDREAWESGAVDRGRLLIRYMHDCTRPDDRILATGSTPYHVNYYADRRVAGGHVFWHVGWRSDPDREQTLLALLRTQSVPFAFSTHDPVFADLKRYPRIHEYFRQHYEELEGTRGLLLVDTRRQPTSRFGELGFPCFE